MSGTSRVLFDPNVSSEWIIVSRPTIQVAAIRAHDSVCMGVEEVSFECLLPHEMNRTDVAPVFLRIYLYGTAREPSRSDE